MDKRSSLGRWFWFPSALSFSRFQMSRKPKMWRDSFLVERGYVYWLTFFVPGIVFLWLCAVYKHHVLSSFYRKPLHKRDDGKEMAQEENFLPKYQRMRDLCQKVEYQTSCQQPGQVSDGPPPRKTQHLSLSGTTEWSSCSFIYCGIWKDNVAFLPYCFALMVVFDFCH